MNISTKPLREAIMGRFDAKELAFVVDALNVNPDQVFNDNDTIDVQVYDTLRYFARRHESGRLLDALSEARAADAGFKKLIEKFKTDLNQSNVSLTELLESQGPDRTFRDVRNKRRAITYFVGMASGLVLVALAAVVLSSVYPGRVAEAGWRIWQEYRDEEARLVKIAPYGGEGLFPTPLFGISLQYREKGKLKATELLLGKDDEEFRIPFDKIHPDFGYLKLVVDPATVNSGAAENPGLVIEAIKYDQPGKIWLIGSIKSIPITRKGGQP